MATYRGSTAQQLSTFVLQEQQVNANTKTEIDTLSRQNKELRQVLEMARAGLLWYQDMHPEDVADCDADMLEKIRIVLNEPPTDVSMLEETKEFTMDRDFAKRILPVIQAYAKGTTVQSIGIGDDSNWTDQPTPSFSPEYQWRVKPEPVTVAVATWVRDGKVISMSVTSEETDGDPVQFLKTFHSERPGFQLHTYELEV
jgi:hypothetical protein